MEDKEIYEELARLQVEVQTLKDYKVQQNGALLRLADKVDRFQWWLVMTLGGVVATFIAIVVRR